MSNKNIPTSHQAALYTIDQPCPPASTLDQPFLPVPTFKQLFPPAPNTNQPHLPQHQPAPLPPSTQLWPACHISMARTKQSARKVTGGHALRVNLEVLQKKKAKAKAAAKKPPLKIQAKDNAVIIYLCLIVSEESLQKVKRADVKFMCMTCHWQKTKNDPKPYMGFYSKGEPALSTPPIIPGGFHHAMTSQVAPHTAALLHLHLEGLAQDIGHSQVAMLHSFLQAYFPQGDYNFSQLSFNLGTPESMDAYDKAASDLANTLPAYSRVMLFLTTHSDEERGDLFSDIIFYVCGSVVTNPQSFNGVKEVAQQLTPRSMLLFDAQHLQLASTVPYLQSLLDNTIIQGFPISSAAKVALNDCGMLGRHSNIILITWQKEALLVEKFL
ncbi:hypothetical protein EDD16DRAFT_1518988 [Pisolithus croceorrhizus]|nr:hypothetical protein EDD16DRAFT_1518988 [Pisolithus croceorrhizus]